MKLNVLATVCEPGGENNEDRIFHTGHTAWVFDGATGLTESNRTSSPSDAVWLVDTIVNLLETRAESSLDDQIVELVSAIEVHYPLHEEDPHKSDVPSAVGAGIHIRHTQLHYLHFGDCALTLLEPGGSEMYVSPESPLNALDRAVVDHMTAIRRDRGLSLAEARTEVLPLLHANRALANTADGYGNLSVFGERPAPSVHGSLEVPPGSYGILASDGFMALSADYDRYSPRELVLAAKKSGLSSLYTELREIEASDPDCVTYPRLKPRDDASAILFEIG